MTSHFLMLLPNVLRDSFLHCVGFFSFVVLHSADVGVSVLSLLPTVYLQDCSPSALHLRMNFQFVLSANNL